MHVHTYSSRDSAMLPREIVSACLKTGVNCLAITDHNRIAAAMEVAAMAPFQVIIGEEIRTTEGEITGLFLEEEIPRDLTPEETIARIRGQGGLVMAPHPCDRIRRSTILAGTLTRILPQIDIIEAFNARVLLPVHNSLARRLAAEHGLAASSGSDAHTPGELGHAYVEMPEFEGRDDFLATLALGRVRGHLTLPLVHFITTWVKWKKRRSSKLKNA